MMLWRAARRYRHITRYAEIAAVLARYGFGDLLSRLRVHRYLRAGRKILRIKQSEQLERVSHWDRVRMALEELGPAFIKLGQFASNRPDMLPLDLVVSLEKLQDAVPPFSSAEAQARIEAELKKPIDELFARFDRQPFASASVAQVHRAQLASGQEVAVKVQRPRIEEIVAIDLEIMQHLALLLEKHFEELRVLRLQQLVDEFADALRRELDFTAEARHFEIFAANFRDDPDVHIPLVFRDYTSRRIITTEFIHGKKITSARDLSDAGLDPAVIAGRGTRAILKQIFIHGFFHADPHAGNIIIMEHNVISFIDLGMAGILTPTTRRRIGAIIEGFVRRDPEAIVRALFGLSDQRFEQREYLEHEIAELLQEYATAPLRSINIGGLLQRLSRIMVEHKFRLIPGFYLLVKSLVTLEGIGYRLDPDFSLMESVEPFARKLIGERYGPVHLARETADTASELAALLRDAPSEARDILYLIKTGRLRIEFVHRGIEPVLNKMDLLVNRIVYGLVLAALVIGSSVVVLSDIPPKVYGLPLIGVAGFITAGIMGFWLLVSMIRNKKM
ncbi:MAG: AarF/ABC1/UbiB kinase family protein [Chitinispirillaceae bacterium]|nr:AarF/ABC1/UbiB kinase family protein [Chitinispirillaceae bacterium]